MTAQQGRYSAARPPAVGEGWRLERLTSPSSLFAANGLRDGPDGRLYIAQCVGSTISALDVSTGVLETITPMGGEIVGPDDLAFDAQGNLFVTEFMDDRVSVIGVDGTTRVLCGDVPGANGITFHQDRLFVDECRLDGRLVELDLDGGTPRVVLEGLQLPNGLAPGPDGLLYFPLVGAGEIWRVHPDGGEAERVVAGLNHPVAVKFDPKGNIVTPESGNGQVSRIDPQNGSRTVLANLEPGLDNLAFLGDRLFVSHHTDGKITEVRGDGQNVPLLPRGFQFPSDVAVGSDGKVYFTDNTVLYTLPAGGKPQAVGWLFAPGFPGSVRGLAPLPDGGLVVSTSDGRIVRYRPGASEHELLGEGFDQLYGVAVADDGAVLAAELGGGRLLSVKHGKVAVLASGLAEPIGVAVAPDGTCLVSERSGGRIVGVGGSGVKVLLDGLQQPQGIALAGGSLFVVDAGAHSVIALDLGSGAHEVIAADLPVGPPPGVVPKPLRGVPPFSGPLGPFAGIAAGPDGTLYFAADTEGSMMALHPQQNAK